MNSIYTDIAFILCYAPKGIKLYSPVCGEIVFAEEKDNMIYAHDKDGKRLCFDAYGRYDGNRNGECILFPSRDVNDWNDWQKILFKNGDIVRCRRYSETYIWGGKDENDIPIVIDANGIKHQISGDVCAYATHEECVDFYCLLETNGLEYNKDTGEVIKVAEKARCFNVGDWVAFDDGRGPLLIKSISDTGYTADYVCTFGVFGEYIPFEREGRLHKWSIKDARRGDVLHSTDCGNATLVFDYSDDDGFNSESNNRTFDSICDLYEGKLCIYGECCWKASSFRPATQNEIDEFLSAANKNGYVWDIRNCELIYVK